MNTLFGRIDSGEPPCFGRITYYYLIDVMNGTHQHNFTELTIPGSRTPGRAERALD